MGTEPVFIVNLHHLPRISPRPGSLLCKLDFGIVRATPNQVKSGVSWGSQRKILTSLGRLWVWGFKCFSIPVEKLKFPT